MRSHDLMALAVVVGVGLVGCKKEGAQGKGATSAAASQEDQAKQAATQTASGSAEKGKAGSASKAKNQPPGHPQVGDPGEQLAGSHILIAYKGAMRARPNVTRSKEEALAVAKKLAEQAKKEPDGFAELAKKNSDGPSAARGGDLGMWRKGQMVPAFDQAIVKLKQGEVSEPVETPFGYHVMKRNPLPPLFAGAHILIAYKGAMRARPNVTRSKKEALELARKVAGEAKKAPGEFAELAKKYSDGPSGPRGGSLGTWPKGRMVKEFDTAIEKLEVGGISDPVETQFGFHVMKREPPQER
jgi:NIMA-interacting peptidyl-prolyl cis-trans isomerase 1